MAAYLIIVSNTVLLSVIITLNTAGKAYSKVGIALAGFLLFHLPSPSFMWWAGKQRKFCFISILKDGGKPASVTPSWVTIQYCILLWRTVNDNHSGTILGYVQYHSLYPLARVIHTSLRCGTNLGDTWNTMGLVKWIKNWSLLLSFLYKIDTAVMMQYSHANWISDDVT